MGSIKSDRVNSTPFLELDNNLWPISGDATQIHQILLNLCVNSRDAMPKGGMLKLSVTNVNIDKHYAQMRSGCAPGRYILISTSDNGEGIPSEHLEKIFDPFFTTKESGKGTGLGLSTVMSIVKSCHGFINVFSELNKGTVFNIYLPVTESPTPTQQPILETVSFLGNGEFILVIDDESAIREITKSTLEVHNYNVLTACDGIEGLTTYVQHKDKIQLVISDIMMPHMDGIATARALQKVNPDIKIISITGLSSFSREIELSSLGIKKILNKPYTADILLSSIAEVLAEGK
jgi:CheY-like chemotaxis protein